VWYSADINDPESDLWTSNFDGTNPRKLTDDDRHDGNPQWHPSGTKVIFDSPSPDQAGNSTAHSLYTTNSDGTGRQLLMDNTSSALGTSICTDNDNRCPLFDASFSPDGTKVAFLMLDGDVGSEIVTADYNLANNQVSNLSILALAGSGEPYWNHDSTKIVFTDGGTSGSGDSVVKVYEVTSKQLIWQSPQSNFGASPQFGPHPDKDLVAVSAGSGAVLFIFDISQPAPTQMPAPFKSFTTTNPSWTWSPNGKKLAVGNSSGNEITIIDYETKETNVFKIEGYPAKSIAELDWTFGTAEEVNLPDVYVECHTKVGQPCTINNIPEMCKSKLLTNPVRGTSTLDEAGKRIVYTPTQNSDKEENYVFLREDDLGNSAKCFVKITFDKPTVGIPATGVTAGFITLLVAGGIFSTFYLIKSRRRSSHNTGDK